ncbi:MAG: flagellar assembly protein FliH [Pseudomonadota bacterium]
MSSSKVIQKEKLTAFQRWELPAVGVGDEIVTPQIPKQEEIPEVKYPTVDEIQKIQKDAYDEAYAAGMVSGKEEGRKLGVEEGKIEGNKLGIAAGKEEMRALGRKIEELFAVMSEPLAELDERVEQELVALVIAMTKNLVRREIKTDPGQIVAAVRQGVAVLPVSARNVRVLLHPEDAALVREILAVGEEVEESRWRIVEDAALARGGCHIESDESRIDATVEARLMRVISQVLGGEREGEK